MARQSTEGKAPETQLGGDILPAALDPAPRGGPRRCLCCSEAP